MSLEVLLVEDEDTHALLIARHLRRTHPTVAVTRVFDGGQALDMLRSGLMYDLILLDLSMPGVGGREVLGELRADSRLRPIPVVVVTGSTEQADRVNAYALGANAFVVKAGTPADYARMLDDIESFWIRRCSYPERTANA